MFHGGWLLSYTDVLNLFISTLAPIRMSTLSRLGTNPLRLATGGLRRR